MVNYSTNTYLSKLILGLLIFNLAAIPLTAQANSKQTTDLAAQPDKQENTSAEPERDLVLGDRVTREVFSLSQNMPDILNFPPKSVTKILPKSAEMQENDPADTSSSPIVIEADRLFYNDATGEILASGMVIVSKSGVRIETEELNGNTKTSQVWANRPLSFTHEQTNLVSDDIFYDYSQKTGYIGQTKGRIKQMFINSQKIDIFDDHYVLTQGTVTGCPAKIPDYHISAEKIEIWPGDKMIVHQAKFLIKNHVIFTMSKYQSSLKKSTTEKPPFPKMGYNSSDGFYIKQYLAYPISRTASFFANIDYYSKHNFRPSAGIKDEQSNYSTQLIAGYFIDSNDNWIKKLPELRWDYHPRRIGNTPVSYRFNFTLGRWSDKEKTSRHQSYKLYMNYDPLRLNKTTFLYFGGGIEHIRQSYENYNQSIPIADVTLTKSFSNKLNTWVSYHYKKYEENPPFSYNMPDIAQELNYGFTYKIDRLNTIGITYRYDIDNHSLQDIYYTWFRNLHCWDSTLTYKSKEQAWKWTLDIVNW